MPSNFFFDAASDDELEQLDRERLLFRPKRGFATRVLILTPARGIHSMIQKLAQFTDIKCGLIVGGLSIRQALEQMAVLRSMPDIVVATPRRMIDHLRNSIMCVDLNDIAVLILDEADRLLQKGFATEIQELVHLCPKRKQTMLFSATMTEEVNELVKLSLNKPLRLSADPSDRRPPGLTEEAIIESDAASESRINSPSPTPRGSTEEAIYISDAASESRSFIYFLLSIAIFESGK